ncbi:hypothetical protein BAUCODRAFT_42323, partial [Baudoinia panamericana UAMH 10762]
LPARLLPPTESKHYDLQSFLEYVERSKLNVESTVYRGTHFEYTVAETLARLGFQIHRVGRSNDLGIDLIGYWHLPPASKDSQSFKLPVVIQCKAAKPTPAMIRELEGASSGAPAGWRGDGVLALLASTSESTAGVSAAVQRSELPLGVLQITREGIVKQFIWNVAAAGAGLEGL